MSDDLLSKPVTAGDLIKMLQEVPPTAVVKIMEDQGQWEQHYWRVEMTRLHFKYDPSDNEVLIGN